MTTKNVCNDFFKKQVLYLKAKVTERKMENKKESERWREEERCLFPRWLRWPRLGNFKTKSFT